MEPLDLAYKPRPLTQPGCIEAILEYLGIDVTPPWLWGASGIAFFMNTSDDLCPSCHHSHGFNMNQRAKNVGYEWKQYWSNPNQDSFEQMRREAWDGGRRAIDAGHPGLLWHWEWMVVRGYDDEGYYLSGKIQEHLPWEDLGSAVGWLELVIISPGTPADDRVIVKEALDVAVGCWDALDQWGCTGVPKGYEQWLAALQTQVNPWGAADMPAVYGACRGFAAGFLREAQARLNGAAADELGTHLDMGALGSAADRARLPGSHECNCRVVVRQPHRPERGPADRVLPLDAASGRCGMKRGLSVNLVHPNPARQATELVLHDRMQTASFTILGVTCRDGKPLVAEPGWDHLAYGTPTGTTATPGTWQPADSVIVSARTLQAVFDTSDGLRWSGPHAPGALAREQAHSVAPVS